MLDRDKPYGTCGFNQVGKKFYQDKKYFNADGNEVNNNGTLVEEVKPKAAPKKRGRKPAKKD